MNTDLTRIFRSAWHLLTDVPGWSEPPLKLRLGRLFPIVLPIAASLLLAGWGFFIHRPGIERAKVNFAPLIDLENEIRDLRFALTDDEALKLTQQADQASSLMLPDPEAASDFLQTVRELAAQHQWVGAFKDYEPVSGPNPDTRKIVFVPAVGKMMPDRVNRKPFPTLLALLGEFTDSKTRIDLSRLAVRVDEQTGPVVEINFQIASHPSHEEVAQ